MVYLEHHPTPLIELNHPVAIDHGVRILVLREDLNHPTVSGNKWWKLKYNLLTAMDQKFGRVLTFGGAYSNHIYATAAACTALGLSTIGIIRGEETPLLNHTLSFARSCGMELVYISREEYRKRHDPAFLETLKTRFNNPYVIPEGGTNALAVEGCREFYHTMTHLAYDKLFVPVGTGGTLAGLVAGSSGEKEIIGVSVLKNGGFLSQVVQKLIREAGVTHHLNFSLLTEYHFGGYAKINSELLNFIEEMKTYDLPLDHVYTGKMFYALFDQIRKGNIGKGETVMAIHTGGLQGRGAYA